MKNIIKIFSLVITILSGIISIFFGMFSYKLYNLHNQTGSYFDERNAVSYDSDTFFVTNLSLSFFLLAIIISAYTFRHLHKNKTPNEDNPTILDYDNATSNPNNEQANQ